MINISTKPKFIFLNIKKSESEEFDVAILNRNKSR